MITLLSRNIAILAITTLVVVACSEQPTILTVPTPNAFTQAFAVLDPSSTAQLAEILTLTSESRAGIIQLSYLSSSNRLLAVYDDGDVLGWNVTDSDVFVRYQVDLASNNDVGFDRSGSLLMAAGQKYVVSLHDQMTELMAGIGIWSTDTGNQIHCLSFSCDPTEETARSIGNPAWKIGATLDPAGNWALLYSEYNINIQDLTGQGTDRAIQINAPDDEYWWHIGRIAFDEVHERFAIVYQEGRIQLSPLSGSTMAGISFGDRTIIDGSPNDLKPVSEASFDPSGRWLAVIMRNELSIWHIDEEASYLLTSDAQGVIALTFDQAGKLLFMATTDLVTIWDIEERVVVARIKTPGILALSISQDNRLMLWGDSQGMVHFWGVQALQ